MIEPDIIEQTNDKAAASLRADYDALGEHLDRRGIDIAAVKHKVASYGIAVPSWGVGTGGTRFARFPGAGEPRDVFDKLDDCGVIHRLTAATPSVSLHIPWDAQPAADLAHAFGLNLNDRLWQFLLSTASNSDRQLGNCCNSTPPAAICACFGCRHSITASNRRQASAASGGSAGFSRGWVSSESQSSKPPDTNIDIATNQKAASAAPVRLAARPSPKAPIA